VAVPGGVRPLPVPTHQEGRRLSEVAYVVAELLLQRRKQRRAAHDRGRCRKGVDMLCSM